MIKILGKVGRKWLKFAELLGTIQMVVLLTLIYWTMLMLLAVPFKLLADPLALKRARSQGWIHKSPVADVLESMRKQG